MSNISEIINPFTEMAYLPPPLAYQVQIARYILVGTAAVLSWDILANAPTDLRLLLNYRINFPTIVFVVSRLSALTFIIMGTIHQTAPIDRCATLETIVDVFYPLSISTTCLLFFFRIRAVFADQKLVVAFFFVLWLSVVATNAPVIGASVAGNIGPTKYCINVSVKSYTFMAPVTSLVHDTLVFAAMSYRLASNAFHDSNPMGRAKTFFSGASLPAFSRMLMQDNQKYFCVTVASNLLTVVMLHASVLPAAYQVMFAVPNVMLTNSMACRVFRNTKTNLLQGNYNTNPTIPLSFRRPTGRSQRTIDNTGTIDVTVTQTVDHVDDYHFGIDNGQKYSSNV